MAVAEQNVESEELFEDDNERILIVYSYVINILEDIERRELQQKGYTPISRKDKSSTDHSCKTDETVEYIARTQMTILGRMISALDDTEHNKVRTVLIKHASLWMSRRKMNGISTDLVDKFMTILFEVISSGNTSKAYKELALSTDNLQQDTAESGIFKPDTCDVDSLLQKLKCLTVECKEEGQDSDIAFNKLPVPNTWSRMDDSGFECINLLQHSQEWENVETKFEQDLQNVKILNIRRIQNMYVWEIYYLTKRKLERRYGDGHSNEMYLFHGTTPDLAKVIEKESLDPRTCGQNGTIYGKGTYFAMHSSYSDNYSQEDENGHKFMFLAKVLVGKYCIGSHKYRRPPKQCPEEPKSILFDSCVNNINNPTIFCIFHDSQFYLEYIIEYTCR